MSKQLKIYQYAVGDAVLTLMSSTPAAERRRLVRRALEEPTEEMTLAAERYGDSEGYGQINKSEARYVWKDMWAALDRGET